MFRSRVAKPEDGAAFHRVFNDGDFADAIVVVASL